MTGQVKLLTAKEVLVMTGYKSRTTLWRRVKSGEFPAPIALSANATRWKRHVYREGLRLFRHGGVS